MLFYWRKSFKIFIFSPIMKENIFPDMQPIIHRHHFFTFTPSFNHLGERQHHHSIVLPECQPEPVFLFPLRNIRLSYSPSSSARPHKIGRMYVELTHLLKILYLPIRPLRSAFPPKFYFVAENNITWMQLFGLLIAFPSQGRVISQSTCQNFYYAVEGNVEWQCQRAPITLKISFRFQSRNSQV